MIRIRRPGLSMVELIVAIVVVGMALGPILSLLGASNRVSNASVFEVMAVHYAAELGEQLQRTSPKMKDLHLKTGKTIEDLLTDPAVETLLGPAGNPSGAPYLVRLPVPNPAETDVSLFVTPLDPAFVSRRFFIKRLDNTSPALLIWNAASGIFWDVTVSLSWKLQPSDVVTHAASYSFILREDP